MAEERNEDRTEPATPRRRQEARERGHVARSGDLSAAVVLLAGVLALTLMGSTFVGGLATAVRTVLGGLAGFDGDAATLSTRFGAVALSGLTGMAPFLIAVLVAAVAANLVQVGFLFTGGQMAPSMERLDPVRGFGRIFSLRALARLFAGFLKVAAVGGVVALTIWGERQRLAGLAAADFPGAVGYGSGLVMTVSLRAALALLVLGLLEFAYQRWQYERDLRMSRHEVREELRRFEGDPRIRERRRAVQRQVALQGMIRQVPSAAVVITNPTHVAVAVRYERTMDAPTVVAKGAERLARRIRETAMEHDVPLVERPELARALYRGVEVGRAIPADLYQGVAEVLACVFRLKEGSAAEAA